MVERYFKASNLESNNPLVLSINDNIPQDNALKEMSRNLPFKILTLEESFKTL